LGEGEINPARARITPILPLTAACRHASPSLAPRRLKTGSTDRANPS